MGMYGSRAITLLVLISDDVINRILKLDIQTNILVYVTRCCTDLTSKVLKERTFGQSSALLILSIHPQLLQKTSPKSQGGISPYFKETKSATMNIFRFFLFSF